MVKVPRLQGKLAATLVGGLLLVGGGIVAGVLLSSGGDKSAAHPGSVTAGTGTGSGTVVTTTTGPKHTGAGTLAFVPAQSYCQKQPKDQLGFWITLVNLGGKDVKDVGFVATERFGSVTKKNPRINGLRVPPNAPKLQTVVSYAIPPQAKVTSCSVRVFSPAFPDSGKEITLKVKSPSS